ncbi:MAG: sensor histidine kinase [Acidimicrobiales bacterium]
MSRRAERTGPARRGSVRSRAALAAAVIVGAAFVLSSLGVVLLLRSSLYTSVTNSAVAEALDISSFIVTRGRIPPRLPIADDETAAQVVGTSGQVLATSSDVRGQPPMTTLHPRPGHTATVTGVVLHIRRHSRIALDLDYRFSVAATGFAQGPLAGTVLVASSLGAADHAVSLVLRALALALPVLVLLVGWLVFVLTGRALRPVELIRSEVASLSALDLHRRVPEPATADEIGRLARTMNAMLGRLEASGQRQRQLVADVSHELRNPLAALRTQLEVAVAHPGPGTSRLLDGSILDVARMSQLVEDLLTLARLDESTLPLHAGEVDVDDVVLRHAERLRSRGRVDVSVQGVGAARMHGDEAQLSRVVANLADNAERYAHRVVSLGVGIEGGEVVVTVADDGPGVPTEMREQIFERFVRLDTARTHRDTGAGLGLAIVREITRAHGGDVHVEDSDPGARFVVRLPVGGPPSPC